MRNDRYFQAVEFFRFLFDFKRSNPFSQFINKETLNDIKGQARLMMLQGTKNHKNHNYNTSPLKKPNRRKFGSELTQIGFKHPSSASFVLHKEGSKEDVHGVTGTRAS
jgi:hypothetical protein